VGGELIGANILGSWCYDFWVGVMLVSLSLALFVLVSAGAPLVAGRWLADRDDREDAFDPEVAAIEAHALILLAAAGPERR
jgi:hypothetical protein